MFWVFLGVLDDVQDVRDVRDVQDVRDVRHGARRARAKAVEFWNVRVARAGLAPAVVDAGCWEAQARLPPHSFIRLRPAANIANDRPCPGVSAAGWRSTGEELFPDEGDLR